MSRRIVTKQLQAKAGSEMDGYFDRVVKYIPGDVVALWITASGLIASAEMDDQGLLRWMMFGAGLLLTLFWTKMRTDKAGAPVAKTQITVSTIAFVVWVFALGGPFADMEWYRPLHGSLLLIVCTVVFGRIVPPE